MELLIFEDRNAMALAAADYAASVIREAIAKQGTARIVAATAASQLEFLDALLAQDMDWQKVEVFHLDEYVGLPMTHPGSFRHILMERFLAKAKGVKYHLLDGDAADVGLAARTVGEELQSRPVDIAFLGIGENGHLAFNDPPADVTTQAPYIIVELDGVCRAQQVAEGWFASLEEVPTHAISMSIQQILKARRLMALVPGPRKAAAVQACVEGPFDPVGVPGSILRNHPEVKLYLDKASAALLQQDRTSGKRP
jgi:glucosamine-6-phosphate deaminase